VLKRLKRIGTILGDSYQKLNLRDAMPSERHSLVSGKVLAPFYDDDRLVHMVMQRDRRILGRLSHISKKKHFIFFPEYIPMFDHKRIITKDEYFFAYNTIDYKCVNCGTHIKAYFEEFSMKNLVCKKCINDKYLNTRQEFRVYKQDKTNNGRQYLQNMQDFYKINKERQMNMFIKKIDREYSISTHKGKLNLTKLYNRYTNYLD
jgi:hypothetical protein